MSRPTALITSIPGEIPPPQFERAIGAHFELVAEGAEVTFWWVGRRWDATPDQRRPSRVVRVIEAMDTSPRTPPGATADALSRGLLTWLDWDQQAWMLPLIEAAVRRGRRMGIDRLMEAQRLARGEHGGLSGLLRMLEALAQRLDACGCALRLEPRPPPAHLADVFPGPRDAQSWTVGQLPAGWEALTSVRRNVTWPVVAPDIGRAFRDAGLPRSARGALVVCHLQRHRHLTGEYERQLGASMVLAWPTARVLLPEEVAEVVAFEGALEASLHRMAALFLCTADRPLEVDTLAEVLRRPSFERVARALDEDFEALCVQASDGQQHPVLGPSTSECDESELAAPIEGGTTWAGQLLGRLRTGRSRTPVHDDQFTAACARFGELLYLTRWRRLDEGLRIVVEGDGEDAVASMLKRLAEIFGAQGARIFGWRLGVHGPVLHTLSRTDNRPTIKDFPLDPNEGLSDFALVRGIAFRAEKESSAPCRYRVFPVSGTPSARNARPIQDVLGEGTPEPRFQICVPFSSPTGARWGVGLWRHGTDPRGAFSEADLIALRRLADRFAPWGRAAERVRQRELDRRLTSQLVAELGGSDLGGASGVAPFEERAQVVLKLVGRATGASAGVLLVLERDGRPRYHYAAEWQADADVSPPLQWHRLVIPASQGGQIDRTHLERASRRGGLVPLETGELREGETGPCWAVIVLLATAEADQRRSRLGLERQRDRLTAEVLATASTVLSRTSEADAVATAERLLWLAPGVADGAADPEEVLDWAAEMLLRSTNADAVFVYPASGPGLGNARGIARGKNSSDVSHFDFEWPVQPGSLTEEILRTGEAVRVLDVDDRHDGKNGRLDRDFVDQMLAELRHRGYWPDGVGLLSWMACPILTDTRRPVGLLKAITGTRTGFLTRWHERLAGAIARRARTELVHVVRAGMLQSLNEMAEAIATRDPARALGAALLPELTAWFRQTVGPEAVIVVVARGRVSLGRQPEVLVRGASPGGEAFLEQLGPDGECHAPPPGFRATPIGATRAGGDVSGHIWVRADDRRTSDYAARESAREILLVLDAERTRRDWRIATSVFRHALMGTLQGLQGQASLIARVAERVAVRGQAQPTSAELDLVRTARGRLHREIELLHRWRAYSRLYDPEGTKVDKGEHRLGDVVQACFERFLPLFRERAIEPELRWIDGTASDHARFDPQVVDVVLANLLDNARKYSFEGWPVTLTVEWRAPRVTLRLTNFGHALPDDAMEPGRRLRWLDPFRNIEGEGVGLPLAVMLLEAHGSTLSGESRPLAGRTSRPPPVHAKRPSEVRFQFALDTTPPGDTDG